MVVLRLRPAAMGMEVVIVAAATAMTTAACFAAAAVAARFRGLVMVLMMAFVPARGVGFFLILVARM